MIFMGGVQNFNQNFVSLYNISDGGGCYISNPVKVGVVYNI